MGPNATRILRAWGLLDSLKSCSLEPQNAAFKRYHDGEVLSDVPLSPDMESQWHAPHLLSHRADILAILVNEAKRIGVALHLASPVTTLDFSMPAATTVTGTYFPADLILGADGERSFCRSKLLAHLDPPAPTGKLVFRIAVKIQDLNYHSDLEHLIRPAKVTFWLGPGSQVVCYELKRNEIYNITVVWANSSETETHFGPRSVPIEQVRAMFKDWDPVLRKLLDLARSAMYWTLFDSPENRVWTHQQGRFVLIGDAAHAMTPYLAQGAAQCIEDAAVLGHFLSQVESKEQIPDMLTLFQNMRVPRVFDIRDRAARVGKINELPDGLEQRERDAFMRSYGPYKVDGYPNTYGDPAIMRLLYGYSALEEAKKAWNGYVKVREGKMAEVGTE